MPRRAQISPKFQEEPYACPIYLKTLEIAQNERMKHLKTSGITSQITEFFNQQYPEEIEERSDIWSADTYSRKRSIKIIFQVSITYVDTSKFIQKCKRRLYASTKQNIETVYLFSLSLQLIALQDFLIGGFPRSKRQIFWFLTQRYQA